MKLVQSMLLVLLPVPLLAWAIASGHYRRCLIPFLAIVGIYTFMILGAPSVIHDPTLYSDRYFFSLLVVILGCYGVYAVVVGLGRTQLVDYSTFGERSLGIAAMLFAVLWMYSLAILALYMSRHGAPPIAALFAGSGFIDFYAVRAEKTTSLAEGVHWYVLGLQTIPYFIFVYSYILKRLHRTWTASWLFVVNAVLAAGLATSFANKNVVLNLAAFLILVRVCVGESRFKIRTAVLYGLAGVGSVFLFLRLYLLDRSAAAVLQLFGGYLLDRLILIYTRAHAHILQIFPREHAFLDGQAYSNPGGLLPFTPVELSQYLGYRVLGRLANYATPAVTHGYANFGWPGILLTLGIMTLQVVVLQAVFRRLPRTPLFASMYVVLGIQALYYGAGPIQTVMPEELLLAFVAIGLLYLLLREFAGVLGRAPAALAALRRAPARPEAASR